MNVAEPDLPGSPWQCQHCGMPVSRSNSGEWFHLSPPAGGPRVAPALSEEHWRECRPEDVAAFVAPTSGLRRLVARARHGGRGRPG